ncbi:HAD-superfamily subfamily IIA hydrolase like protein [Caldalkalibacillus thermarum TA2.A1]|uniref:Acid sugar phosphatase n=1 Tax=Caldalkalibacillus thermarum (strain TA2.A1) TaxID=986075 RepID=F5L6K8_CALTT|nr:TIGR01457 family HAD-type hydrolase [Caldalkalibacillus thermarum]EGL83015.1 HAD-superfamily subfamily IIA hydrolase like protein [Caldalkalibacillus thermarum TA2.A1]QZT33737.1 TIGR01457 family HAD-type hydrolase [Caldalkalibacillus thermarum TA2.A1]
MRTYKLFVLDLDGTMYRGDQKIEEAPVFIRELEKRGLDYVFLTNNATKTPQQVVDHLARFDIITQPEKVYTTSVVTAQYVTERKKNPTVYVVGERALVESLRQAGCQLVADEQDLARCDFVVMGLDRQVTYEKLAKATLAVRAGAQFISTNKDKALPTERGLLPGNGSLTAVVQTATGIEPTYIGKPEPLMLEMIMAEKGLGKEDVLMIGDNYETDILAGIRAGVDTAIVFTGFTTKEDLARVDRKPTYEWETLLDAFSLLACSN